MAKNLVRYCPECSSIGEPLPTSRDCCPDGSHAMYVSEEIARQARLGFMTELRNEVKL